MSLPWYIDPDKIDGTNENGALLAKNIREDGSVKQAIYQYGDNINVEYVAEEVINRFTQTGMQLVDEVNAMNKDLVIDLGCGFNPYVKYIKNCVGTDVLAYKDIDIQSDFAHTPFIDDCADVCLCLTGQFFRLINNEKALTEVKRIAKDGCIIYCRTPKQKFRKLKKKYMDERGMHRLAMMEEEEASKFNVLSAITLENDTPLPVKMGEKFGFEIRTPLEEGEYVEGNALTVEPEYGAPASSSYYVEGNKHKLNKFPRQHYYWTWTVRK